MGSHAKKGAPSSAYLYPWSMTMNPSASRLPDLVKQFGFAAHAFSSAEAFLASDCVDQTRCLLLDVSMPGMSGPDLQQELIRRRQEIPIIFITAKR